jgi:CHASE2 domain
MPTWLTRFSRLNSATLGLLLTLVVLLLFWLDEAHQTQKPFVVAWLHRLELLASDLRFRVRGPMAPGPEVVIAAIDEQSVDELGRWPWPYTVQAQLIRRLTSYGAAAIGYDVVFSSSDTSAGLDNLQTIKASLAARGYYNDAEMMQSCKRSWSIPWLRQTMISSSPPPCKNRVGRFWATFFTGNARTSPICLKANWSAFSTI